MTMMIAKLTEGGLDRVLDGKVGMTFIVDSITENGLRRIARVRDYRYPRIINGKRHTDYQIWSIGPDGYQLVTA